jgi:predicted O-methyltransferase YrrM
MNKVLELGRKFKMQTTDEQAVEMYNAILSTPPGDVVEVGSATGGTAIILIHAAKLVGKTVYSVDPYPVEFENVASDYPTGVMSQWKREFKENILTGEHDNIIQYNEDIKDCIFKIPNKLSVVFIDGMHEYSFALRECELLWPKLVEGGIMYFHDMQCELGQLTKLPGSGLNEIPDWFTEKSMIGSMLKVIK